MASPFYFQLCDLIGQKNWLRMEIQRTKKLAAMPAHSELEKVFVTASHG